ncbi:MAG: glycosyltransferase domain-containing protein [Candidatus Thorarchaeota archaeon]
MKKVVYTVLLGQKYKLNEPKFINNNWNLKCFTDQKIKSKNWQIINISGFDDPRKKSREIKIANHRFFKYDICLYLDSRFTIKVDLDLMVKEYLQKDISVMTRKKRPYANQEIELCIKLKLDKKETLLKQLKTYRQDGFPEKSRLYSPGIMFKRNSKKTRRFMEMWYSEVKKHSYRDIVSFAYTLWKYPIDITTMPHKVTYRDFMDYTR